MKYFNKPIHTCHLHIDTYDSWQLCVSVMKVLFHFCTQDMMDLSERQTTKIHYWKGSSWRLWSVRYVENPLIVSSETWKEVLTQLVSTSDKRTSWVKISLQVSLLTIRAFSTYLTKIHIGDKISYWFQQNNPVLVHTQVKLTVIIFYLHVRNTIHNVSFRCKQLHLKGPMMK